MKSYIVGVLLILTYTMGTAQNSKKEERETTKSSRAAEKKAKGAQITDSLIMSENFRFEPLTSAKAKSQAYSPQQTPRYDVASLPIYNIPTARNARPKYELIVQNGWLTWGGIEKKYFEVTRKDKIGDYWFICLETELDYPPLIPKNKYFWKMVIRDSDGYGTLQFDRLMTRPSSSADIRGYIKAN